MTNLRYADDIILLASSVAELQELVNRLDHVSKIYSLLINTDKTKTMASPVLSGIQLGQVDTFPYLGSKITEDAECTKEIRARLSKGHAIGGIFE